MKYRNKLVIGMQVLDHKETMQVKTSIPVMHLYIAPPACNL